MKQHLELSFGKECLSSDSVARLNAPVKRREKWILAIPSVPRQIDTREGIIERELVRVPVMSAGEVVYLFADRVTGTLYRDDGLCLSSLNRKLIPERTS